VNKATIELDPVVNAITKEMDMGQITRYDFKIVTMDGIVRAAAFEDHHGFYVKYSDYAAAKKNLDMIVARDGSCRCIHNAVCEIMLQDRCTGYRDCEHFASGKDK
jgi:hypothetical protein